MAALPSSPRPGSGRRATAGRHARWRRGLGWALVAALVVHAAVLLSGRLPAERGRPAGGPLVLVPQPVQVPRPPIERGLAGPGSPEGRDGGRAAATTPPVARAEAPIPVFRESAEAGEETTIPTTTLHELRAATLPLVPTGTGIGRRRLERSPEAIAVARAESLLFSRMGGLVQPARDIGAIGLANGGITIAIPWQGFLPSNRTDDGWREERCSGSGDGDADKAGEGEARRAQCS